MAAPSTWAAVRVIWAHRTTPPSRDGHRRHCDGAFARASIDARSWHGKAAAAPGRTGKGTLRDDRAPSCSGRVRRHAACPWRAARAAEWMSETTPRGSSLRGLRSHSVDVDGVATGAGDREKDSEKDRVSGESVVAETAALGVRRVNGESGGEGDDQGTSSSLGVGTWNDTPGAVDLPREALPQHVAIIMDGNARWARGRQLPVGVGHERGVDALRSTVRCCAAWGIPAVTVYAFSHENWNRDRDEVDFLMGLLERTLQDELPALVDEGVRVCVMGDMGRVSQELRGAIDEAVRTTAKNTKLRLNVALSYGARQDIVSAARLLATKAAGGFINPDDISEEVIASHLSSGFLPSGMREPDLLIRTSGEQRLSNFLLWEMAYTELYFTELMWPEFGEAELRSALHTYAKRHRRFGHR